MAAAYPAMEDRQLIKISAKKRALSSVLYLLATGLRLLNKLRRPRPNRLIVFEPFGLGDLVTFEPLVRELVAAGYETIVCSRPQWRPILPERGHNWVDMRVPFVTHDESAKYTLSQYTTGAFPADMKALKRVAPGATGIETRGDIRCVILLYAAGCRRVISLSNYMGSNLLMWRSAAEVVPFSHQERRWELNMHFAAAVKNSPVLQSSPPFLSHLARRTPEKLAALMPIAPWAGKWWPRERWEAVSNELRRRGYAVVGYCGPKQTAATREQLGPGVPVIECESIPGWAAEFNRAAFVITVDSGPMHLADALGTPVIALFGTGKLPLWAPSGPRSIALSHQDDPEFYVCHPIEANTWLGQKYMNKISVEEVLAAVDRIQHAV